MNMQKVILLILGLVVALGALGLVIWGFSALSGEKEGDLPNDGFGIASFEECVAAGYDILESNPRQCRTPDGTVFVEDGTVQPGTPNQDNNQGALQTPAGPLSLSYEGGFVKLEGTLQRNNACVNWIIETDTSGGAVPAEVRLNVLSEQQGEVCAQVISQQQISTLVRAQPDAQVTVIFEGDIILFSGSVGEGQGSGSYY